MHQITKLILFVFVVIISNGCGSHGPSPDFVAKPGFKPTVRFEIRRASYKPVDGWIEQGVKGTDLKYHICPEVEITNADLRGTSIFYQEYPNENIKHPEILFFLTKQGNHKFKKMTRELASDGLTITVDLPDNLNKGDKPIKGVKPRYAAFLIDGEIYSAPKIMSEITQGFFNIPLESSSKEEAEVIVKGLIGQ